MEKQINQIVKRREKLHLNDPRITECWNELVAVLSGSEELTIAYLLSCEEQKLFWLSEVFDDLSVRFNSLEMKASLASVPLSKSKGTASDPSGNCRDLPINKLITVCLESSLLGLSG